MKGFFNNIERATLGNANFRTVLYTARHAQIVVMSLKPSEEIGEEVHKENDQFFRIEQGACTVKIDDTTYEAKEGDAFMVPAGATHNVINASQTEALKLYTIYSPPHHRDGVVHANKSDAEHDDEHFDGVTTE